MFCDALTTAPEAQQALDLILHMYRVEHDAKEQGIVRTPAHLKLRKTRSAATMDQFHTWLLLQQGQHLPKGPMGKAISCALDNWVLLPRFLKSEQIAVDNNASERTLHVVALGRKNYLFAHDEETGSNHAALYTILATCGANSVPPPPPPHYLTDILPRVKDHPSPRLDELLPQNWKSPGETARHGVDRRPRPISRSERQSRTCQPRDGRIGYSEIPNSRALL